MTHPEPTPDFRWQALFQASAHPLFVLNRQRRLLFANQAWETCTGLRFAEVRGRACRRRRVENLAERSDIVLSLLSPPAEAREQNPTTEIRRVPWVPVPGMWWRLHFVPLGEGSGIAGYLGWIHPETGTKVGPGPLPEKLAAIRHQATRENTWEHVVADSPVMRRALGQLRLATQISTPILLTGSSPTNKEQFARLLHHQGSTPGTFFLRLSCRDLSDEILQYWLQPTRLLQTGVGTVFLDQIQALSRDLQVRMLDLLAAPADDSTPTRWIFGLDGQASETPTSFVPDFWANVTIFVVPIPSLQDRVSDLPRLISLHLQRLSASRTQPAVEISDEAKTLLGAHAWPGEEGELQNVLRAATKRAGGSRIEVSHLPFYLRNAPLPSERNLPLDALLEKAERNLIQLALRITENNHTKAADLLGIWRARLIRRLEKLGFDTPSASPPEEEGK